MNPGTPVNNFLGIGKMPQHALDVNGDVNCSGEFMVNGVPISGGGGSGPAGTNAQIQFNSAGAFGASPNFLFGAPYGSNLGSILIGAPTGNKLSIGVDTGAIRVEAQDFDSQTSVDLYIDAGRVMVNSPLNVTGDINITGNYLQNGVPIALVVKSDYDALIARVASLEGHNTRKK